MQTIDINYLNPTKGSTLLDLGCGEGRHCFGAYMYCDLDVFGFDMNYHCLLYTSPSPRDS